MDLPTAPELHLARAHSTGIPWRVSPEPQPARDSRIRLRYDRLVGIGWYAPFAVNNEGQFLSNGGKIRNLFVVPDAEKRSFFYGVNFELSYETPPFSQTPW